MRGRGWLNSPERSLSELRGQFVLLDFWTSACVNCVHVIEELRPLEERYADVLTVIGVHSPKFPYEATPSAVVNAVAVPGDASGAGRPGAVDLGRVRGERLAHLVLIDRAAMSWRR